jgi:hypothetical protein
MIRVIADDGNFLPGYMAGKWWDTQLIQTAATRQCFVKRIGGSESCLEFTDAGLLPLTAFLGSAPDGFTVHNWPCFLSLDDSLFNSPVPEGLYGRTITDGEGSETILTWAQWGSTNLDGRPILTDGTRGIPLVHNHRQLTNVECAVLYGLTGYTLLNEVDYRALKPALDGV